MSGLTLVTFGCRLNIHESEAMRTAAGAAPDLVIVNTCAVTEEATRQARQAIRRLRRERPGARIAVTGCAAQIDPDRYAAMEEVDHVVGNAEKLRPQTWAGLSRRNDKRAVSDIMTARDIALPELDGFEGRARGFVQVQNGCDHRCTFCIIPFGRGNSRSLPAEAAVAQVRRLAQAGYGEVVLTGVDLTSYGADLDGRPRLGALVRRILREVPELARLRLSSIDSVEADAELLAALAEEERLMPHLHLSLQSGDDLILKRMKRRHSRAEAERFCVEARRLRPDVAFGADIIAGFPTETEAMFRASLDLIEACGIVHLHAFPFSPRPGTPAARMPQLPTAEIRERAARLRAAGAGAFRAFLDAEIGRLRPALMERGGLARTGQFAPVRPDRPVAPGTILPLRLTGHDGTVLAGTPVAGAAAPVLAAAGA
ncbi:tRNA (N(6)-L-threonylcarbamoyladenosine(37)-C(2))-methylthiotransferase MtaB [Labrys wisconsinensis]|uniref:Threonylcarbamoyladenosine tRNA methylthiotransferase MtaB n=1 Tax=Labrys wisconsinensis TaxID=425677 RepID=A0ABU0J1C6_9HYPH|nr:tRNA (N(6)-L-threonylcarbamoyladenosine(37)-C(2))-methylthiotransferase MtaB [Labrys wisconsinensis]MDQ0468051.1 threonylcarbamoyladenosine tRNA methylthiotransferase MtaB [Labrys wisconsinensis]